MQELHIPFVFDIPFIPCRTWCLVLAIMYTVQLNFTVASLLYYGYIFLMLLDITCENENAGNPSDWERV